MGDSLVLHYIVSLTRGKFGGSGHYLPKGSLLKPVRVGQKVLLSLI